VTESPASKPRSPGFRLIDAGVRKEVARGKIIGSCDDSEDVRIEIHRALARTRIKENVMACNDGPRGNCADIRRQWGCQQDILVLTNTPPAVRAVALVTLPPMDVAVAGSAVASSSNARIPNLFMLDPSKFEMTTRP
jgi:hypothetical protein